MEPFVRVWHGTNWTLELPGPVLAQVFPSVVRPGNILDGPILELPFRLHVERAEIDGLERLGVRDIERDPQKAPLSNVLPFQVDFDDASIELHPIGDSQPHDPVGRIAPGLEPHGRPAIHFHGLGRRVVDGPAFARGDLSEVRRDDLLVSGSRGYWDRAEDD